MSYDSCEYIELPASQSELFKFYRVKESSPDIRYPIDETTEVEEVIKYFGELIQLMINQKVKLGFKVIPEKDDSR